MPDISERTRAVVHLVGFGWCCIVFAWNVARYATVGGREHLLNAGVYAGGMVFEARHALDHARAA